MVTSNNNLVSGCETQDLLVNTEKGAYTTTNIFRTQNMKTTLRGKHTYTIDYPPVKVRLMAVRWLMLRQIQATWALLFGLSVSMTPGGEISKFRVV